MKTPSAALNASNSSKGILTAIAATADVPLARVLEEPLRAVFEKTARETVSFYENLSLSVLLREAKKYISQNPSKSAPSFADAGEALAPFRALGGQKKTLPPTLIFFDRVLARLRKLHGNQ